MVTTATMAIATNPAMNAYSNAVTPNSLRAKFRNRCDALAVEPTSRELPPETGHAAGGHIASEICSDVGGQSSTPLAAPSSVT